MKLTRVMAGEYRCDITGIGTYYVWDKGPDGWAAQFSPKYMVHHDLGHFRLMREARKACSEHAVKQIHHYLREKIDFNNKGEK